MKLFSRSGLVRIILLLLLLSPLVARAHLGSPNVFFEGPAGPYPVRVTIQPPAVVPGLAQIHVRIHSGQPQTVTVLPVRWDAGTRGAPPPDTATLVPGETNLFTAQLWLMNSGAYSVFVDVSGPQGHGTAIVPFNSLALQGLTMPRWMAFVLFGVGLFLLVLLVSIIGSAARESVLPAGLEPTRSRRLLAAVAMTVTLLIATGLIFIVKRWWDQVDRNFRYNRLYQVKAIAPVLETQANGSQELTLHIPATGNRRSDSTPLVADHGQLMHLFLIRKPEGDAFAHLHPLRETEQDGKTFATRLPALPAGDYDLYADITHESGFTETLTNVLHLSGPPTTTNSAQPPTSPDDSLDFTSPQPLAATTVADGFQLTPAVSPPFRANEETTLRFDLTTAAGTPAPLEPYLGMYGHLMIQHADGTVFAHLHPLGSISMASQKLFAEREHATYLANQPLDLLCAPASPTLAFPYAFPKPGHYRLWLQTKLQGQVHTATYGITVE
jgi:hypothetical protein